MSKELVILIGPPGSGKTTYAQSVVFEDPNWVRVNRDDFRIQLTGTYSPSNDIESLITKIQNSTIEHALTKYNVIVDNTHLKLQYIKEIVNKFKDKAIIKVKIIGQDLSLLDLIERNNKREKKVPNDVLSRMYKQFQQILKEQSKIHDLIDSHFVEQSEIVKQDKTLPKAIIVDIDGTIANHEGIRSPYEWHKVNLDKPIIEVLNIIALLLIFLL